MGRLIRVRNKLAFPAGRTPGIDQSHPAAAGLFFSLIPTGGGQFLVLESGKQSVTVSGTPTSTIDGVLGPTFNTGTSGNGVMWPPSGSGSTATLGPMTVAMFFRAFDVSSNKYWFTPEQSSTSDVALFSNFGNTLTLKAPSSNFGSISISQNVPFFTAFSWSPAGAGNVVGVLVNLNTGAVQTTTATGATTPFSPSPLRFRSVTANSNQGPAMLSAAFLPMAAIMKWAADPWSFWYPSW